MKISKLSDEETARNTSKVTELAQTIEDKVKSLNMETSLATYTMLELMVKWVREVDMSKKFFLSSIQSNIISIWNEESE